MERPTRDDSYILVVDDNEELCQTLSRLLRRHNFATRSVGDGDIALSCILERPLAMILDHQMERVDGISLLTRMRDLGVRQPLDSYASASRQRGVTAQAAAEPQPLLNLAFLVHRESVADFRRCVERAGVQHQAAALQLALSGPWPPYSFCPALEMPP
jgi:CheY-like chemotaxis protein